MLCVIIFFLVNLCVSVCLTIVVVVVLPVDFGRWREWFCVCCASVSNAMGFSLNLMWNTLICIQCNWNSREHHQHARATVLYQRAQQ